MERRTAIPLDVQQRQMSAGELRFIEPFLERACFMCGTKGDWSRRKKHLCCNGCRTEFVPLPGGELAVAARVQQPAAVA